MVELYEKDGNVGILVSRGFGAGWSTWNDRQELAYDKRVVEFWLTHKDDDEFMKDISSTGDTEAKNMALEFLHSIGYEGYICLLGFEDIELEFVPHGIPFRITEYDGSEALEFYEEAGWIML